MTNAARSPSADAFARAPLPKRFCNLDRLIHAMKARGLDGIVATAPWNVFYLTGFNGIAHKSDEPRPYAVIVARHAPEHPIMVLADYYLATFLKQPTWVEDLRPFRAVMMPLDLPAKRSDIDRFIPRNGSAPWIANARATYAFDMASAVRGALTDLKLDNGRVGFDDMGFGFRLEVEGLEVADGYDPLMFARAVKTPTELRLLERATALNEAAIRATMAAWDKGVTWRDLNRSYARAVTELGGFVRDPGGMVWGHPRGADPALTLATGLEDDVVEPGTHVMSDFWTFLQRESPLMAFPLLQRIALPITIGSVRYPGIKIHETRIIRLMEVLLHGGTHVGGWTAKEIHQAILTTFDLSSRAYGLNQLRYDLRKLKGHALLQRDGSRYAYHLTTKGVEVALLFLFFHKRLCGPLANSRFHHQPKAQHRPNSRLETAYHHADKAIQTVVDLLAAA